TSWCRGPWARSRGGGLGRRSPTRGRPGGYRWRPSVSTYQVGNAAIRTVGSRPTAMSDHKWVYDFAEGSKDMRDLLGGKGANVAEMTRVLGTDRVPAGFTITTEACVAYMKA